MVTSNSTKRKRGRNFGGEASSSAATAASKKKKKKKNGGANVEGDLGWVYRNHLHKERYDLSKDCKFICGRSIDWDALLSTNFGPGIRDYLSRARWLGLANLTRSTFSPQLVWEFYFGIALKRTDFDMNEFQFQPETLYTFFNDKDQEITPEFLGTVIGCFGGRGPVSIPSDFDVNVAWREFTGINEVHDRRCSASLFKTLTLRFLHHFIASTVQCRSGSFNLVTREDLWMLHCIVTGQTIDLPLYILNKMKGVLKAKLEACNKPQPKKILLPYATVITEIARKLGWLRKYELQSGAVLYNLRSIGKMGYKEIDGVWVKIRRLGPHREGEEEEEEEGEGANQEEDLKIENVGEDPEGQPSNAMLLDLLRRLDQKSDHMFILLNECGAKMGELEQTSRARFDQIEDTLGQIQADIQRMAGSSGTRREYAASRDLHYYLPAPPLASDPSLQASPPHESF